MIPTRFSSTAFYLVTLRRYIVVCRTSRGVTSAWQAYFWVTLWSGIRLKWRCELIIYMNIHFYNFYTIMVISFKFNCCDISFLFCLWYLLCSGKLKRDDVLSKFNQLVHGHYVERCPKGEPFLEPKIDADVSSVRKHIRVSIDWHFP